MRPAAARCSSCGFHRGHKRLPWRRASVPLVRRRPEGLRAPAIRDSDRLQGVGGGGRQADVDGFGLPGADVYGRRVRLEALLAHFDAMTPGRELHLEAAAAFWAFPPPPVGRDTR